jgi:uncharacterized membrane protein
MYITPDFNDISNLACVTRTCETLMLQNIYKYFYNFENKILSINKVNLSCNNSTNVNISCIENLNENTGKYSIT